MIGSKLMSGSLPCRNNSDYVYIYLTTFVIYVYTHMSYCAHISTHIQGHSQGYKRDDFDFMRVKRIW